MPVEPIELTAEIVAAYELTPPVTSFMLEHAGKNNLNTGLRTGAGTFVLRDHASLCYADPASIQFEHELLTWLAGQRLSFAVPVPIPTRNGQTYHPRSGEWIALAPLLSGRPLARQDHDGEILGSALGELQSTLQQYPATPRPGHPLFGTLFRFPAPSHDPLRLTPASLDLPLTDALDARLGWWREEFTRLQAFVDGPYGRLPRQVCHNDVTPNNVHAEAGVITAVLDFEFATVSARALDFATGLRLKLRSWEETPAWEDVRQFCRGYRRWVRLTEEEIAALPDLLRLRAAITVIWWIGRRAAGEDAGQIVADRIGHVQNLARWLAQSEGVMMDVVSHELR